MTQRPSSDRGNEVQVARVDTEGQKELWGWEVRQRVATGGGAARSSSILTKA